MRSETTCRLATVAPQPLKNAYLVALDSPRQAFYRIWIEPYQQAFRVCKASGGQGRIWHQQAWEFDSLKAAEDLFLRRLREKTDPDRRSRRKYRLVHLLPQEDAGDPT